MTKEKDEGVKLTENEKLMLKLLIGINCLLILMQFMQLQALGLVQKAIAELPALAAGLV